MVKVQELHIFHVNHISNSLWNVLFEDGTELRLKKLMNPAIPYRDFSEGGEKKGSLFAHFSSIGVSHQLPGVLDE